MPYAGAHQRDADRARLEGADLRRARRSPVPALRELRRSRRPYADSWNPNAGLSLGLGGAQFGFGFADVFARIEDPPYATRDTARRRPGSRHSAHQQPGLDRRALVAGRRSPHLDAAVHQHGEHLRQQRDRDLQLRERDDQHADARRLLEVAPQDGRLPERLAGLRHLPQRRPGRREPISRFVSALRHGRASRSPHREDLGRPDARLRERVLLQRHHRRAASWGAPTSTWPSRPG